VTKKTKIRDPQYRGVELTAHRVSKDALKIVKGNQRREWMDELPERFAYRCLPLLITNQAGWDLLCPTGFSVRWSGKPDLKSIKFRWDDNPADSIASHFGSGVLTFTPGYLFRTSKDHNLWVKGCPNLPKDGVTPLEGIVETDWAPFTFTMNWKITRAKQWIRFDKNEPICRILPFPRYYLDKVQPRTRELSADKQLQNQYVGWRDSRAQFIDDLHGQKEKAVKQGWQRTYVRGQNMRGVTMKDHQTKLNLRDFFPSKN